MGMSISGGSRNRVGGAQQGQANLFCDIDGRASLSQGAEECVVAGNSFGVTQNRAEGAIGASCVGLSRNARANAIAGDYVR